MRFWFSLFLVGNPAAAEQRDLVLKRPDDVGDDSEDDKQDYDYNGDNDVAFNHFGGRSLDEEAEGKRGLEEDRKTLGLIDDGRKENSGTLRRVEMEEVDLVEWDWEFGFLEEIS